MQFKNIMDIRDFKGDRIDTNRIEKHEQDLANEYILENDVVLELGARYGSVSCIINSKLNNKTNQVVVEPDERVWNALEENRKRNNCEFHIVKGFISEKKLDLTALDCCLGGYGSTFIENKDTNIPSFTLDQVREKYKLNFNVLVADCEGFLEVFFDENPGFYDNLRFIMFEADYKEKCNYDKIKNTLREKGFVKLLEGHQNVWINLAYHAPENIDLRSVKIEVNPGKKQFLHISQLRILDTRQQVIVPLLINASNPISDKSNKHVANDGTAAVRPFPFIYHSQSDSNAFYEYIIPNTEIGSIEVYNRLDCCTERLADFTITITKKDKVLAQIPLTSRLVQKFKAIISQYFEPDKE
jgi:FkbM family methyltransferase